MLAYASRTGTRENLAALDAAGWGLLVSARGVHRDEGFADIVVDNGAWTSFQRREPFDAEKYREVVAKFGARARWVVLPDVVCGSLCSLAHSIAWRDWTLERTRAVVIPTQDGMEPRDLEGLIGPRVGLFMGGSDDFKIGPMLDKFAALAKSKGAWFHVGRVNSIRRLNRCRDVGADSFDGSGPSRFRKHLERMQRGRDQGHLFGGY